jgi:hypothetical protein
VFFVRVMANGRYTAAARPMNLQMRRAVAVTQLELDRVRNASNQGPGPQRRETLRDAVDVEAIQVHHLGPCAHEGVNEVLLSIRASMKFSEAT